MVRDIFSLYRTTNCITGRYYYGVHKETKWPEIDSYLGSGTLLRESIAKYGKQNFSREILIISDNPHYIYELESKLVTPEVYNDPSTYNVCGGGIGPSTHSDETKEKLSEILQGNTRRMGTTHSQESRQKISESQLGKKNNMYGKHHSNETRKKMSDAQRGEKSHRHGKTYTEEEKRKISDSMKRVWAERRKGVNNG